MNNLTSKKCVSCEGGTLPLGPLEIKKYLSEVKAWKIDRDKKSISRDFEFNDFAEAVDFVDEVAHLAEAEGHHPNIFLHDWNEVRLTLATHTIGGLSENDFILAAKIDRIKR